MKKVKKLALCAMLSALGTVLLLIGSFIEVLDMSMALLASLLSMIMVVEYGGSAPWSVYGVTSILSLLLLPNKFPALLYALFFGYYPIIKEKIERLRKKIITWPIKICIFSLATALLLLLTKIFTAELDGSASMLMTVIFAALSAIALILYDIVLTRIISFYIVRLRQRFKKIF